MTRDQVFKLISTERDYQDQKWGSQRGLDEHIWNTILSEEVGEVAEAIFNYKFTTYQENSDELKDLIGELVQVAAVAVAWLEMYETKH